MKKIAGVGCVVFVLLWAFISYTPPISAAASARTAVCAAVQPGHARCLSYRATGGTKPAGATPTGLSPADLQAAYHLSPPATGKGPLVAIVDAYDYPTAEADLSVYRAQYGLTPCTSANHCFTKVNQKGLKGHYPVGDPDWAQEMALDLDMVSAICPNCRILLVEANTNADNDLYLAVRTAVRLHAKAISNSWGDTEYPTEIKDSQKYFKHPRIAITAASGDSGYGVFYPAASQYVTAVGGTTLNADGSGGWTETAWAGAGSGCSAYSPKPAWQKDTQCANRSVADVAAVANGNIGVSVYDTYQSFNWMELYGTSVASPIIASVYALAGNASHTNYGSYTYSHSAGLTDITSGSNGTCAITYLCNAGPGYDGPTGNGTPNGLAAF